MAVNYENLTHRGDKIHTEFLYVTADTVNSMLWRTTRKYDHKYHTGTSSALCDRPTIKDSDVPVLTFVEKNKEERETKNNKILKWQRNYEQST
jgi:hypothetical protein